MLDVGIEESSLLFLSRVRVGLECIRLFLLMVVIAPLGLSQISA